MALSDPRGWFVAAATCFGYQWLYVPALQYMKIEPWSLTWYGVAMLAGGVFVAVLKWTLES